MKISFKLFFICLSFLVHAQDQAEVITKNFHFTDGVYLSFEEFQTNDPSVQMEDVYIHSFTNPQTFLTQVDSIYHLDAKKELDPEQIWAICMDGVPFIKIPKEEVHKELPSFAAIKLRGKICYFTYPDYRTKKVPVAAYNPLTGRPFL